MTITPPWPRACVSNRVTRISNRVTRISSPVTRAVFCSVFYNLGIDIVVHYLAE